MKITGKVHCFFEQSGTFKRAFIERGITAEDYDIQNNFGETNHVLDLFSEIDNAYEGKKSIFDHITNDDLILAFYPCIYFCATSQMNFYMTCQNYKKLTNENRIVAILKRSNDRQEFYNRLIKFCGVCISKGIRMVFENPYAENTYLKANFIQTPAVIDMNRSKRGDFRIKPTAYWFFNCSPTRLETIQKYKGEIKTHMKMRGGAHAGLCSEDRSMISLDYARNFISDFILGEPSKNSPYQQQDMFDLIAAEGGAK